MEPKSALFLCVKIIRIHCKKYGLGQPGLIRTNVNFYDAWFFRTYRFASTGARFLSFFNQYFQYILGYFFICVGICAVFVHICIELKNQLFAKAHLQIYFGIFWPSWLVWKYLTTVAFKIIFAQKTKKYMVWAILNTERKKLQSFCCLLFLVIIGDLSINLSLSWP